MAGLDTTRALLFSRAAASITDSCMVAFDTFRDFPLIGDGASPGCQRGWQGAPTSLREASMADFFFSFCKFVSLSQQDGEVLGSGDVM